jgi:iron(III) transport system ATP-binding protein
VGITTVLVTHEQEEAFHLGDRVAVLQDGVLHQVGSPEDLYERPATRFVATFVGRASVLPCVLEGDGAVWVPHPAAEPASPVRWSAVRAPEVEGMGPGEPVDLVVRPESLAFVAGNDPGALSGRVTERRYAGPVTYYQVSLAAGGEVEVLAPPNAAAVGDAVRVAPASQGPAPRIFRTSTAPAA